MNEKELLRGGLRSSLKVKERGELTGPGKHLLGKYMRWGFTKDELLEFLDKPELYTVDQANEELQRLMEQRYSLEIKGKRNFVPWMQRMAPGALIAYERGFNWAKAMINNWPGSPGTEPGTIMTVHDTSKPSGLIAVQRYLSSFSLQHQVIDRDGEDLSRMFPVKFSPLSERKDPGFVMSSVIFLLEGWLSINTQYINRGEIKYLSNRLVVDVALSKEVAKQIRLKDIKVGITWENGQKVIPFEGAMPVDVGLKSGYAQATLLDAHLIPLGKSNVKLRMVFERRSGISGLEFGVEALAGNFRMTETNTADLFPKRQESPGLVMELLDQTLMPTHYWGAKSRREWAQTLKRTYNVKYHEYTIESLERALWEDKLTWYDVGQDLQAVLFEEIIPRLIKIDDMVFSMHKDYVQSSIPQDKKNRISICDKGDRIVSVIVKDVPMLEMDEAWLQGRINRRPSRNL